VKMTKDFFAGSGIVKIITRLGYTNN